VKKELEILDLLAKQLHILVHNESNEIFSTPIQNCHNHHIWLHVE